jgi:hypothetical protein
VYNRNSSTTPGRGGSVLPSLYTVKVMGSFLLLGGYWRLNGHRGCGGDMMICMMYVRGGWRVEWRWGVGSTYYLLKVNCEAAAERFFTMYHNHTNNLSHKN